MAAAQVGCGPGKERVASSTVSIGNQEPLLGLAAKIDGSRYGSDPDLMNPLLPWAKTMTDGQLRTAAALGDMILPADNHSPSASEVGVPDFIDEWVSAPYPQQQGDRERIFAGLEWLEQQSRERFDLSFASASDQQRKELLDDIAYQSSGAAMPQEMIEFFERFRFLAVAAFYATEAGTKDVGYVGNVPISGDYPGPSEEAMAHLNKILDQLGLTLNG